MRMSLILPAAAALAVAAVGLSSPAGATEIKEAIKLCKQNPSCKMGSSGYGYNFTVGTNEVWCPEEGECVCLSCVPPKQRIGPFGTVKIPGKITARGALTSSSGGSGSWTSSGGVLTPKSGNAVPRTRHKPERKPVPTAEPKPAPKGGSWTTTTSIPAKPKVRDHRVEPRADGDRSSPGVKKTRYPYDIGASNPGREGPSKKRLPEVRDHRGVDAASREGPSDKRKPETRDHRRSNAQPKSVPSSASNCTPANRFCQRP